jgi:hypothetical protein
MAANWTPSQPGGAGAGTLHKDLEVVRTDVQVLLTAEAAAGYLWTLFDKPDAAAAPTINNSTSQVANVTFATKGRYGIRLTDASTGTTRTLYLEVNRDAAGTLIDHGIVAPALGETQATSPTNRGVARTMERFAAAVLVAIAAGGGADLDPAGPLALGTVNATSVDIGRTAAPFVARGSTMVARSVAEAEFSGADGMSGLFVDGAGDNVDLVFGSSVNISSNSGALVASFYSGTGAAEVQIGNVTAPNGRIVAGPVFSDIATGALELVGGNAWTSAVTNVVGGKLRLRGGNPKTAGTHKHGDVQISVGRYVADGTTAKFAITYGDASDDPFENELVTFARTTSGGAVVAAPSGIYFSTTSGAFQASAGAAGDYLTLSGTGSVALVCSNDSGPVFEMTTSNGTSFYNGTAFHVQVSSAADGYGAISFSATQPSTDILAPQILFMPAPATSFATAVAARKVGGSFAVYAAPGRTPGTDPAGPIYFGLGQEQSGSNWTENGIRIGSGVAVGTPGAADFVPYTSHLLSIRSVGGVGVFYGHNGLQFRATGSVYFEASSTMTFAAAGAIAFDTASTFMTRALSVTWRTPGNFDWMATTPTLDTRRWEQTGYAGREEKQGLFYAVTAATGSVFLAGRYTPSIANGLITIETTVRATSTDGGGARTGYAKKFFTTFRITAGVMGAVGSPTTDYEHTTLAVAPSAVALSFDAGNTQFGVAVNPGDTRSTRWEATCVVHYAEAA